MKRLTIDVEHKIGDIVYSRTDMDQKIGIVLGYEVTNIGVEYIVTIDSETKIYNPLELSSVRTIY